MMMRNKAEELALLDPILITFRIYEIKKDQLQDLMTLRMRSPTLVNLQIHVVNKEEEKSGNKTTEEMKNIN